MLVLTRRLSQSIKIGDGIEITIIEVRGDQVRIGISALKDVSVYRAKVYQAIQQENRAAVSTTEVPDVRLPRP